MGIEDTFHFDGNKFAQGLQHLQPDDLIDLFNALCRCRNASGIGILGSGILAIPTAGASLVPGIYSLRQQYVNGKKRDLVEAELGRRGMAGAPRKRLRDMVFGQTVGLVAIGAGFAVGGELLAGVVLDPGPLVSGAAKLAAEKTVEKPAHLLADATSRQ